MLIGGASGLDPGRSSKGTHDNGARRYKADPCAFLAQRDKVIKPLLPVP